MLAWLVIGVAMAAGLYESAFAALARLYGHDARGSFTGITLIAGFASTVGWQTTTLLMHSFGWRGACFAWAAAHLLIGLPLNAWSLNQAVPAAHVEPPVGLTTAAPLDDPGDRAMRVLAFMFMAFGIVGVGVTANLPRLFAVIGTSPVAAIAAASLMGPAQVVARMVEYSARRRIDPLISAKIASALHPVAALVIAAGGAAAAPVFALVHGAGNGMQTIVRGTLPLALFGPEGYGARIGRISAPGRIGQAFAPFFIGLAIDKLGAATLFITAFLSLAALVSSFKLSLRAAPAR